jgi:hypothetical protein
MAVVMVVTVAEEVMVMAAVDMVTVDAVGAEVTGEVADGVVVGVQDVDCGMVLSSGEQVTRMIPIAMLILMIHGVMSN